MSLFDQNTWIKYASKTELEMMKRNVTFIDTKHALKFENIIVLGLQLPFSSLRKYAKSVSSDLLYLRIRILQKIA